MKQLAKINQKSAKILGIIMEKNLSYQSVFKEESIS